MGGSLRYRGLRDIPAGRFYWQEQRRPMVQEQALERPATLCHISEEFGIQRFDPRPHPVTGEPAVWAIESAKLRNYLLPRDCPRVTFEAAPETAAADAARFLNGSPAVVAVESVWWERIRTCRLCCYHLPPATFRCIDDCAGYYISRVYVHPLRSETIADPVGELLRRGVELRVVPNLWPLRDAVVGSTLRYSIIRMRNATTAPLPDAADRV